MVWPKSSRKLFCYNGLKYTGFLNCYNNLLAKECDKYSTFTDTYKGQIQQRNIHDTVGRST